MSQAEMHESKQSPTLGRDEDIGLHAAVQPVHGEHGASAAKPLRTTRKHNNNRTHRALRPLLATSGTSSLCMSCTCTYCLDLVSDKQDVVPGGDHDH